MPAKAHQSSQRLAQAASGNPLPFASAMLTFALLVNNGQIGDLNWTGLAGQGFRVLGVRVLKIGGAAGNAAANTVQLRTAAGVPITNAIDIRNVADQAEVDAATIDDAVHGIAAGGGLRVFTDRPNGADNNNCIVYVDIALT